MMIAEFKRHAWIIVMLILMPMVGSGQQAYIDSLERLVRSPLSHYDKMHIYFNLGKSYRNVNAYLGIDYLDTAQQLAKQLGDELMQAKICNENGVLYRKMSLYPEALDQHEKAIKEFEILHDSMGLAFAYANIGNVFVGAGQLDKALEYNLKSLQMKKLLGDSIQLAYSLRTTAMALQALHQYDTAIILYHQAIEIYQRKKYDYALANTYYHLGSVLLLSENKQNLALIYLSKAKRIFNKLNNVYGTALAQYEAGKIHLRLGESTKAKAYFDEALQMAIKANNPKLQMDIYHQLAHLYAKLGDYQKAFENHHIYALINDSLYSETFSKNLAEMAAKFKNDQQKTEIALLKKENELIKNEQELSSAYLIMLVLGIVFSLLLALILYFRNNEKKKNNRRLEQEIIEGKKKEQKLLESEKKLSLANDTKDKFFSIISHDLRSPFGAVRGLIGMLASDYDDFDNAERREMIDEINRAANHTFDLLNDLLAWSRTQRGTIDFRPETIELKDFCHKKLDVLLSQAQKKNIIVQCEIKEETRVNADRNMLDTILRNMVSNAIKFTHQGGSVWISAGKNGNDLVQIQVKDNGVGINKERLSEIFDVGSQYTSRGTNNEGGTGLGLVLCKEFVEKHQGTISVESHEGRGSTFIFTLPA